MKIWKAASEKAALERLYRSSDAVRDNCVESLIYLNVPRLHHYAALSHQPDIPNYFDEGIPGDGYIAPELARMEQAIARLRFHALNWHEAVALSDDLTGVIISFEGQFRTKNGPRDRNDRSERDLANLNTAPQIYQKFGEYKLTLPYDPKYVTTTTAVVELTHGQTKMGGFAQVKLHLKEQIVASPLIIGLHSNPEMRAFMRSLSRPF